MHEIRCKVQQSDIREKCTNFGYFCHWIKKSGSRLHEIYFCPNWDFLSLPVSEGGVEDPGGLRVGREFGGAGGLLAVMQWMDDYGWHGDPDLARSDDNPD